MIGKIFVTGSGCDPVEGKHVKDPYLGPNASLGACRYDIRERLRKGDHVFVVSAKVQNVHQVVMGEDGLREMYVAHEAWISHESTKTRNKGSDFVLSRFRGGSGSLRVIEESCVVSQALRLVGSRSV